MKRFILAALVWVLVSGPALAGSREIDDCEALIKGELKFPGSYKKEYVIKAERPEVEDDNGKSLGKLENSWIVEIEFTARTESNQVRRRDGHCALHYEKAGSWLATKKLMKATSIVKIKYE